MKSICIKVCNQKTAYYLLESLNNFKINDIYFSFRNFKIYKNVIIHYKGLNEKLFYKEVSKMLASLIINLYEKIIIQKLIKSEYFYFNLTEQNQILNFTFEDLNSKDESLFKNRYTMLSKIFYNYLIHNRSIVLKGFIIFRLKPYFENILLQIDKSVNKYIIEKEYTEFISLLKMYVNSEVSNCKIVHLVYHNLKSILLDEHKNIVNIDYEVFDAKYLSDISFSANDYTLNTLLNMLPQKIIIHLVDEKCDEFINTLKLIFENRIEFCSNCNICDVYKNHVVPN